MSWRIARSLEVLRNQVNAMSPNRDKSSDGTIGDERHQASRSEHNPDENGVVRALDITHDPTHGVNGRKIAEALIASRDPRILYVISNGEINSSEKAPWHWRPYHGVNGHFHHVHISVVDRPSLYDSLRPWALDGAAAPTAEVAPVKQPTSIRTNNPGALNDAPWVRVYPGFIDAKVTTPGNKTAIFASPEDGVAAWWELLRRYGNEGVDTVGGVINKYGGGQDYSQYISFVVKQSGLSASTEIDLDDNEDLLAFAKAMFRYEAGVPTPLSDAQILAGFDRARKHAAPNRPRVAEASAEMARPTEDVVPAPHGFWGMMSKVGAVFSGGAMALFYDWRVVAIVAFLIAVAIALFVDVGHIRRLVNSAIDKMLGGSK